MSDNILISGLPGCGKTTLIRDLISGIKTGLSGFFTEEIRGNHGREGFRIVCLGGHSGILAHKKLDSAFKVGSYGVDIEQFEHLLAKEKLNIPRSSCVIIDEIGKMELFSDKFCNLIQEILDSEIMLVATILYKSQPFADKIKGRRDARLYTLNRNNYTSIKNQIENHLKTKAIYS